LLENGQSNVALESSVPCRTKKMLHTRVEKFEEWLQQEYITTIIIGRVARCTL